jgi:hypothetical protein
VQPVQLYEAVLGLGLLLGACYLTPRRRFHGQVGLTLLFAYAVMRFLLEALRGDPARGFFGPHLEPRFYLPMALLLFSAAFAYGPGLSFRRTRVRVASIALSTLPAALFAWLTWDARKPVQLSATQWSCLLLGCAVAYAWVRQASALLRTTPGPDAAASHEPNL